MSDCIFCAIAAHELPATFVREDDEVLAIRDVNPQAPVHVLVLPREHIESVAELTPAQDGLLGTDAPCRPVDRRGRGHRRDRVPARRQHR